MKRGMAGQIDLVLYVSTSGVDTLSGFDDVFIEKRWRYRANVWHATLQSIRRSLLQGGGCTIVLKWFLD